jgi:beta-N-acetylhexosaminidase
VFSDDLEMKAIADHYTYEEAAVRGLNAGVDNFLCCHSEDVAHAVISSLARALEEGRVESRQLKAAERRVALFLERWARPAEASSGDETLLESAREQARTLLEEIHRSVAPESLMNGSDPTEAIEQMRKQAQQ